MSELVFLLEEQSAAEMLKGLLPRLALPGIPVRYIVFEGKSDLEEQLVLRLQHYQSADAHFVILRDQDAGDCKKIKEQLVEKCRAAGRADALVRIACHELESWYLADLAAVEKGLMIAGLAQKQDKAKFRKPDLLANTCQELEKLTNHRYQTVGGSRAIGPYLDPANKRSKSFEVFIQGINNIIHPHGSHEHGQK
ncbi:MAG: DUF4276 family protein [Planctomycetes bacterium]|nr:DUF4276 family protein [Planctomycetota bacterium]